MGSQTWKLLVIPLFAVALTGCKDPDPKAECVRWRTEMRQVQGRWGVVPPIGLDYAGTLMFLNKFEQEHPNYKAERDAIRKRYGRTLRTVAPL